MKHTSNLALQNMELDRTDRKILSILQQDGRIANVELAERIGLSPTSIGERLKRLQREGFIEGYGARLNPHRLGLGLLVFVEVLLDKTTPDNFERFARAVKLAPEVLECHMVAGGFDYLVKARLADMTARIGGFSARPCCRCRACARRAPMR
ncbi:Lrp/AsnC family leucine-responsive transcriptional regulator [Bradyrhizobium sp. LB7.2]